MVPLIWLVTLANFEWEEMMTGWGMRVPGGICPRESCWLRPELGGLLAESELCRACDLILDDGWLSVEGCQTNCLQICHDGSWQRFLFFSGSSRILDTTFLSPFASFDRFTRPNLKHLCLEWASNFGRVIPKSFVLVQHFFSSCHNKAFALLFKSPEREKKVFY